MVALSHDRVEPKTMKLVFVAAPLSTQHYRETVRQDWLARNQDYVSEWGDMYGLLCQ